VRSLLFFTFYLGCEVAGIACALALALVGRPGSASDARYFRLQCWWARSLLRGAERLFDLHFEVTGDGSLGEGPLLVFIRHASVADTLLPAVFLSDRHGLRLRYVIKRDLLWYPCLDLVGHRLPNYFVDRKSEQSDREIAGVRRLAEDLRPGEGVLIYPEGTRFSEAKRQRILERMGRSDPAFAIRAKSLRHVLPPRRGGPMALLDVATGADVVFCAHFGFDGVTSFSEFLGGGLVGRRIRVAFWRVRAAAIPAARDARESWLLEQWERVDACVAAQRGQGPEAEPGGE
jgi:1-acyl-sn-glycerol-3-phosphate acyltransferase